MINRNTEKPNKIDYIYAGYWMHGPKWSVSPTNGAKKWKILWGNYCRWNLGILFFTFCCSPRFGDAGSMLDGKWEHEKGELRMIIISTTRICKAAWDKQNKRFHDTRRRDIGYLCEYVCIKIIILSKSSSLFCEREPVCDCINLPLIRIFRNGIRCTNAMRSALKFHTSNPKNMRTMKRKEKPGKHRKV